MMNMIQTYIVCMAEIKNIHIALDMQEYKKLMKLKDGLTWHDYLCRKIE